MQEWYKSKANSLLFFIFLVLSTSIYALEECKGTITRDEIPCFILLPYNESEFDCTTLDVSVYNESDLIYTQVMANYSPFFCNATFNQTAFRTYNMQYSTGDTGSIIVEEGFTRFYIYITLFIVAFGLLIMGYFMEQMVMHIMAGFLLPIMAWDIFLNGFPNVTNVFLTNSIAIILAGLGFYYLIVPSLRYFEVI